MGFTDWLKNKSLEKSKSNITDCLPSLITAVRTDLDGAMDQMSHPEQMDKALEHWRSRKEEVIKEQKKLYENIAIWSSIPPEQIFNDVILPELFSEKLISISDPSFGPVVVACYRVCETAANNVGVVLSELVSPEILELVQDAGDLYQ